MIDKFKSFLAGSPYRMDDGRVEGWAYQVAVILPSALRKWHDTDFGDDVWAKDGGYYAGARKKLSALSAFKLHCAEYGEILQTLKLLVDFFEDEKRKSGLGKTMRVKKVERVGGGGDRGGGAHCSSDLLRKLGFASADTGGRPLPAVEVLAEGEIKEMHISKHERNAGLRKACIEHWRAQNDGKVLCSACGLVFGEVYGEIGEGYIEVHHLSPISQIEGVHAVDPKTDLVPLCANCHAMIHRLMAAEKKATGVELEGTAALQKLRDCLSVQSRRGGEVKVDSGD